MTNKTPFIDHDLPESPSSAADQQILNSLRHSQVQQAIADLVREIPKGTHLTAPEVYRRAREAGLTVSLSTIYRTLNHLQAHGSVASLSGDHGRRYEHASDDHDHLICLRCGLTIEFVDDLIRGFGKSLAQRKGFEHKSSRFDILGLCSACKDKDESHRIENAVASLESTIESAEQAISLCRQAIGLFESRRMARALELSKSAHKKINDSIAQCDESISLFAVEKTVRSPE